MPGDRQKAAAERRARDRAARAGTELGEDELERVRGGGLAATLAPAPTAPRRETASTRQITIVQDL